MGVVPDIKNTQGRLERDASESLDRTPFDDERRTTNPNDGARTRPSGIHDSLGMTLLASARHELRSPLQSVQGFAELLGSEAYGPLGKEQQAFVDHIVQGSIELGSMLDACLELAEFAIAVPAFEPELLDAQSSLADALDHAAKRSGTTVQTRYGNGVQAAHIRVDRAALRRAFQTLHTGLATGPSRAFRADVAIEADQLRIGLSAPKRAADTQLISVDEYARRRRATRGLIWLRLSASLFSAQSGGLLVSEQLDCAEVRIHLSSTH